jgi:hypothetical protein
MDKEDLLLEQWKLASELHRHEDNLTWQKFNYFIATNGILVSVLGITWSDIVTNRHDLKVIGVAISVFGAAISLVWSYVHKRGQLYQNYRIAQARDAERVLTIGGERILRLYEKGLNEQKLMSVRWLWRIMPTQDVVFVLALSLTIGWLALFVYLWLVSA